MLMYTFVLTTLILKQTKLKYYKLITLFVRFFNYITNFTAKLLYKISIVSYK